MSSERHFSSTDRTDIFRTTRQEDKVEMYVHQVEKGSTRLKMPTANSQRPLKKRKKDSDIVDTLPKYEMHQGPEPQDFLENTRPSFFENLMGIQDKTRREDVV